MGNLTTKKLAAFCTLLSFLTPFSIFGNEEESGFNLADAFAQPEQAETTITEAEAEVEPVVVGREKWSDKPASDPADQTSKPNTPTESNSVAIQELDALETRQNKTEGIDMKISPPQFHRLSTYTEILRVLWFSNQEPWGLRKTILSNWRIQKDAVSLLLTLAT